MPVCNQAFYLPDRRQTYHSQSVSNQTTQIFVPVANDDTEDSIIETTQEQDGNHDTFDFNAQRLPVKR